MNRNRPCSTLPIAPCQRESNANALKAKLHWKHVQSQQTEMVEDAPCEEIQKEATAPKTRLDKIKTIIGWLTFLSICAVAFLCTLYIPSMLYIRHNAILFPLIFSFLNIYLWSFVLKITFSLYIKYNGSDTNDLVIFLGYIVVIYMILNSKSV